MRKNKLALFVVALFVVAIPAIAQHEEPILLDVHYQFKHVYDINNRDSPYTHGMVLHLGETNSKYTDGDAEAARKARKKAAETAPPRTSITVTGHLMANVSSINLDVIYQVPFENKLVRTASVGMSAYIIETPAPAIKWKIEKETRKIDKYTCQKAVGIFGGRTYTAWFTTELPFKNGPWKLCGLPGLILEARDSKDEVAFIFKEISKPEPDERIATNLVRPVKVDEKTFERARKLFSDDPTGALPGAESLLYTAPSGRQYWNDEARAAIKNDKKVNNNPIELTRK
jgi:GLPGLI family protein